VLGKLFDTYSNLYADIGARYAEISPIAEKWLPGVVKTKHDYLL